MVPLAGQLLILQETGVPGVKEHQQVEVEDATCSPEMSGTSFCAAVWIPVVSSAVPRFWPPYWAPARAALETSIARKTHRPKSIMPNNITISNGIRSATSTILAPASRAGRKNPFARQ
jgi:hypothetical protein